MLTMIRNMLRTRLAGLLFVLLIVAMGAWGVTDVFSGGLGNNLAAAGDVTFSEEQLDQEVERQLRTATDQNGRAISKAQAVEQGIVDQIYQRELFRTALIAYADRLGARASDDAVIEIIRENEAFEDEGGQFNAQVYRNILQTNGMSPSMFERSIARDLTISRLTQSAQAGLDTPDSIARLQAAYDAEERKAAWFILEKDSLPDIEPVTDEDVETYYQEQEQQLTQPPRRAISLISLTVDDFINQPEFSEEELRGYYDAVKSQQFTGPDTRTWTEFVFETEAAAQEGLARLAGGSDGTSLTGLANTAERSGRKSTMANNELAEDVFAPRAQPGSLAGPVQTGNFFTVVRLDAIEPGELQSFEEVRPEIVDTLSREQAVGLFYDSISRLDSLIGTGASLEEIGSQMGTPVLSYAPIDRNGITEQGRRPTIFGSNQEVLSRAFELAEGQRTPRIGQDETAYIVRVDEAFPSRVPPLEEVSDRLRQSLERERRSEIVMTTAEEIKRRVEAGEVSLSEAASEYDATAESPESAFTRDAGQDAPIPQPFVSSVFSLREEGDVQITPLRGQDRVALIQLSEIDRPTDDELDRLSTRSGSAIRDQLASDLLDAFAREIQNEVDLQSNPSALDSYKARANPDT